MRIYTSSGYGLIQSEFELNLPDGYTALVGKNDSGKSSLLQLFFKILCETSEIDNSSFCILLPERVYIEPSLEVGGHTLRTYNENLHAQLVSAPLPYHAQTHPSQSAFKLLIQNYRQRIQLDKSDKLLDQLRFSSLDIAQGNQVVIDDIGIGRHGSGLRMVLPIVAALTDPSIKFLLIDEPELSLEPSVQKCLRDMFYEASKTKQIVVSTHSHLFLNREDYAKNIIISHESGRVKAERMISEAQLYDLTFDLLGNGLSDLFFPENFLIVEGSSDQVIVEKFLSLMGIDHYKVKVFSAAGFEKIESTKEKIIETLRPLVLKESPYRERVVVLADRRNSSNESRAEEICRQIGQRYCELDTPSIEEYLPEELYARAGRDREQDLKQLESLKSNYESLRERKRAISTAIASVIEISDLDKLPVIAEAINLSTLVGANN